MDRIFAMDRIYGGGRWFDEGYCEGKRAMLSLTTGGGPEPFSEGGITGEINTHFNSINYGIFRFVGFDVLPPFVAWAPARIGEARQKDNIEQYVERVLAIPETEPIACRPLSDYDPRTLRLKTDE
ncbi:MAG: NAD(P)H-dependent oxidoreductase [Pseudomonadota bacterium]|nr:NAD(P)H-dependent oxidoreductase [Pseudomonadota bacterium]MEC8202312.1 NAD(P)H-dependent oxidoreductase [Pseudomonadota bacterium]MEC8698562.1 NAD(P)H-dependent oxidoreductase [Pseudomonadota bacterium]MED6309497.1 NAD(P)H-dependent oxidoreductase [Pseudomonadota bacterium]